MKHQGPIQIAFVKWGTKYGPEYVNGLVDNIRKHTSAAVDFVCFTDDATDLSPHVQIKPFPDFGVPVTTMTGRGGSLLKMSMFLKGQLKTGVPTLYIDLDSSVAGDVTRLVDCLEQHRGVYMLQRHAIPHWRFRALVRAMAPGRYYLANTAVMAFYVEDWHGIAERFMVDFPQFLANPDAMTPATRRLYVEGNERIISQATRDVSRVFPSDVAIKFTQEYMSPLLAIANLKDRLPWVKARRKRQVVVSYQGESLKPAELVHAKPGDLILYKYYKTRWSYPDLSQYWQQVLGVSKK